MKKWTLVIGMILITIILAFVLLKTGMLRTMSHEDLVEAIEIVDIDTKWVEKEYRPWPPKLILVPAISFKVKNLSDKPINYINFNAIFRFKSDFENLGDCFLAAIRAVPVQPGENSDPILLKSNFGVEGRNLDSFKKNPQWKTVFVKLFAKSKGSQFIKVGEWDISRKIDFKEPDPVVVKPVKKEKPEEKK